MSQYIVEVFIHVDVDRVSDAFLIMGSQLSINHCVFANLSVPAVIPVIERKGVSPPVIINLKLLPQHRDMQIRVFGQICVLNFWIVAISEDATKEVTLSVIKPEDDAACLLVFNPVSLILEYLMLEHDPYLAVVP